MGFTKQNYAELISSLPRNEKISFYELLAHNLTISCRGIWSNEELSKDEMIESMKRLNEILRRITAKIRVERLQLHNWKEDDVIEIIVSHINQCPKIGGCSMGNKN
jgi:Na+/phosphate symporter